MRTREEEPEAPRCLWGPYQVACAIVEEKRIIRNKAGIMFWRPAFVFNEGRVGPRVSDGRFTGFASHNGRAPDLREVVVRACWYATHLNSQNLRGEYGIDFRGNPYKRPVLTESMCENAEDPARKALQAAQAMTLQLAWS